MERACLSSARVRKCERSLRPRRYRAEFPRAPVHTHPCFCSNASEHKLLPLLYKQTLTLLLSFLHFTGKRLQSESGGYEQRGSVPGTAGGWPSLEMLMLNVASSDREEDPCT